jgi:hypothetical protein
MVHPLKLTFVANNNNLTGVGLTLGETICIGSLEFTADCFSNMSLSLEGNDLGAIFVGMVHIAGRHLYIPSSRIPLTRVTEASRPLFVF